MVIGFGLKAKFWIVALICIAAGVGVAVDSGSGVAVANGVDVAVGSGAGVCVGVAVAGGRVWTPGWLVTHLIGTSRRSTAEPRVCGPCMMRSLPPT
jgi:uncharacterized membrane protein